MTDAGVVIIGGGVAGLSTAWHLAHRAPSGTKVRVFEREEHLCARSSGLNAAILRTLDQDAWITRICARSAEKLHNPPNGFSEVPLTDRRGLVMVAGSETGGELETWLRRAGDAVRAERLSPSRFKKLVPHYAGDASCACLFPEDGRIDIAALCAGFTRFPSGSDVAIYTRTAVREVVRDASRAYGVRLADGREIRADVTVIAAGAWAAKLVASPVARALRPTRRHLMVTAPDVRVDPSWPVVWSLDENFYCRPESGGMLLCACDQDPVDPDACAIRAEVCEWIAEKADRLLPGLREAGVAHFWCGMRTLTADHRFVVGPDPGLAGLFWVAGLGGHGMIASFEIGRVAADLLTGRSIDGDLAEVLDPARFPHDPPGSP